MTDLSKPLTAKELDRLDDFLLGRIYEDDDDQDKDEGIIDISSLDGFFTAIASAPEMTPPSVWLPVIWGDYEPEWTNEKEFTIIFTLMMRHMNSIIDQLEKSPDTYHPVFMGRDVGDEEYLIVDEWCDGYMTGVYLIYLPEHFNEKFKELIGPMIAFGTDNGWDALEQMEEDDVDIIRQSITPAARKIYAYWSEQRKQNNIQEIDKSQLTFQHKTPKVSRNDPCPCGSGKKYKKCCLH